MSSFTSQSTGSSGQSQGPAQTVVASVTQYTGTVPAGNNTPYLIIPTVGLANCTAWKWTYTQTSTLGAREALAWGVFTKDQTGNIAAGSVTTSGAGTAAIDSTPALGALTKLPSSIVYTVGGTDCIGLTTDAGSTAAGSSWLATLTPWA
jgi:hypothetical protein